MRPYNFAKIITPILKSQLIKGYAVGLTKNINNRRASYKRVGWEYFYIIEAELSQDKALSLEKQYFEFLTKNKKSIFYKKYDSDKRDGEYISSIGGVSFQKGQIYSIYIACYE